MKKDKKSQRAERYDLMPLRDLADQAFSRAAGAPLIGGNHVRLLKDAKENYPAWLNAIGAAKKHVHFENYILYDDMTGREFAGALIDKAREGVSVRVIYDWLGGLGKTSRRFWNALRSAGVEVRCYNPLRFDRPLGWLSRDHRKMLAVDGEMAFITGLCVGHKWLGDVERKIEPWRDTGVEIRGPVVVEVEQAFLRIWSLTGEPLHASTVPEAPPPAGEMNLRIVASEPATMGMLRLDQLIAALARKRLWLTDAYYAGTVAHMEALRSAARDGVDVRLLLPNTTDIPLLQPLSRAGYRPLLEAGVRVFEWNGTMLHAKTAVADGIWARVGSTNLNIASWIGNCELDVVVEDASFAAEMEEMYEQDLAHATEIILDQRQRLYAPVETRRKRTADGGSTSRATAGAVRIGHTLGTTLTNRRVLGPIEAGLTVFSGLLLCLLSVLFTLFPKVLAYPLVALGAWGGLSLLYRGYRLAKQRKMDKKGIVKENGSMGIL
jgi:cardiolipin synthase A/B